MSHRKRRAFTLLEITVVIGIVAVLAGLLLPAVQRVRAAAARAVCADRLRQIGLALHGYHDRDGHLPPGMTGARPGEPLAYLGWLARLLPFVEQDALWRATLAAYATRPDDPYRPPHVGFATPMKLFGCPSDDRVQHVQIVQPTFELELRVAPGSYLGVLGIDFGVRGGVLFKDSRVRWTDVTDGTSGTLAAGERPPDPDFWYGWWYAGTGQAHSGSGDSVLGVRELKSPRARHVLPCPPGPYPFAAGSLQSPCDIFHFWSLHPGGAHFLFCDGSVRFLSYAVNDILPALATRAGGETADVPD